MSDNHIKTRKKANTYFFSKVFFNLCLVLVGAILISSFLRTMQNQAALGKQRSNSEQALSEAIRMLSENENNARELTQIFHDGNQDMLDDLHDLFDTGLFMSLSGADTETRSEVFADIVKRSGVEYLYILSEEGKIAISPYPELAGVDPVERGLLTERNMRLLLSGTKKEYGTITPAYEVNSYGSYYFYSEKASISGYDFVIVLGADASVLDIQIASLSDLSSVLSRTAIGNNGFLFAVDKISQSFLYYEIGNTDLTGKNAIEAGLTEDALEDGYSGIQTINGVKYHCVSRQFGRSTVICAVADTDSVFANDKYVLFWSITGFVMVMLLSLSYAVIVRNDFVRRAVETKKKIVFSKNGNNTYFDESIFKKVFPLMMIGVIVIFSISFYTQTLLEISESIEDSVTALEEITSRYELSTGNREAIQKYYDNRFLSKARLIAYLIEEDPSLLNDETEKYYTIFDEDGNKHYLTDDEGNWLKSIAYSKQLSELCEANDIDSIYVFDEDGHTIATNTPNWFFVISQNPEDQSYPFLDVLKARKEYYVQEVMTDDFGEQNQYIGVEMHYYTGKDEDGKTVYLSHFDYDQGRFDENGEEMPVNIHRSLLQIGLSDDLTSALFASTDTASVLSSDILGNGFVVLFDTSPEHVCLFSPFEASIGKTAAEMGVSENAFGTGDYYGFTRVNGVEYFQYFRYIEGYYIGTAIPRSEMYQSRLIIALITSLTSLILILFLSGTVTLTSDEEEYLYETMAESENRSGLDSAIFNIILPSGKQAATVKAAARWDNRHIPWSERSPEQKLLVLVSFCTGILLLYAVISIIGVDRFFAEGSVIQDILRGEWDRNPNVFAFSACAVVMIMTVIAVTIIKIPVNIISSMLGARGETVAHLLLSVLKYGGTLGALFYCLYLIGMDATNLLASASILSLVIGLGAPSLIKDIIAGIFIVFEGEFRVGDIVTISGYRGTVMDIGLRTTKIMSADGNIKIYNNSEISGVLNMTKEASIAVTKIDIEYGQDIDYVEEVLKRELPKLKDDNPKILEGPTYLGVSELGASGITISIFARCYETNVMNTVRYMNKAVLKIFYKYGINVPFPNITVSNLDMSGRKTIADLEPLEEESETKEGTD